VKEMRNAKGKLWELHWMIIRDAHGVDKGKGAGRDGLRRGKGEVHRCKGEAKIPRK